MPLQITMFLLTFLLNMVFTQNCSADCFLGINSCTICINRCPNANKTQGSQLYENCSVSSKYCEENNNDPNCTNGRYYYGLANCQNTCCGAVSSSGQNIDWTTCKVQKANNTLVIVTTSISALVAIIIILCIIIRTSCCKKILKKKCSCFFNDIQQHDNSREPSLGHIQPVMEEIYIEAHQQEEIKKIQNSIKQREKRLLQNNKRWISEEKKYDRSATCSICLDSNVNIQTNCLHNFHSECLSSWILRNSKCPLCVSPQFNPIKIYCSSCNAKSITEKVTRKSGSISNAVINQAKCPHCRGYQLNDQVNDQINNQLNHEVNDQLNREANDQLIHQVDDQGNYSK